MKKNLLNKKRKSKAFTLVELIIVIAIIAILAAAAVPKFLDIRANSNKKADLASAKNLMTAAETAIAEDELSTSDLTSGVTIPNASSSSTLDAKQKAIFKYLDTNFIALKTKGYNDYSLRIKYDSSNAILKVEAVKDKDTKELLPNTDSAFK